MSSILPNRGGFRWKRSLDGHQKPPVEEHLVASNNTLAFFLGDVLRRAADGTLYPAAAGDTLSDNGGIYGVFNGVVRYKDSSGVMRGGKYLPAATTYTGTVSKANPQATVISVIPFGAGSEVFEVDCSTAAATDTAAQSFVGNNADHVAGAGSTSTGQSGHTLNTAAPGTAAASFRIVGVAQYGNYQNAPYNDVTAANWKAEVVLNEGGEPPYSTTGF